MKNKVINSIFAVSLLMTAGCSEDYLNTEPTQYITQEQYTEAAENNPALVKGLVSGIYSTMFEPETGGTTDDDDFGQKGYDIYSDMLAGDMALSASVYGWYSRLVNFQGTIDFTRNENYKPWRYYYRIIRSSNIAIKTLGGNDVTPVNQENKYLMGQAKALRAYAYFYLTQFYSREYEPSRAILPIYTDPEQQAQPKSSTADVYALITNDLNSAISLLNGYTRENKNQINDVVAKGLLAYTYAAMGMNTEAKNLSIDIVNNGGFPKTTLMPVNGVNYFGGGFNNVATPSWMWGADLTTDQGIDLVSWWGQVDIFTYSYASAGDTKVIDNALFATIPASDVRRSQFSSTTLLPIRKFFDPARVQGGQRNIVTDLVYMRVDEFYLLGAEAAAKSGDEATAKTLLTDLLSNRLTSTAYIAGLTGQPLLDEIYKQTRIELWGEGKTYLAMKRNHRNAVRGTNHVYQAGTSVPSNDERLTFKLPQAEVLNNPFIDGQNY